MRNVRLIRFGIDEEGIDGPRLQVIDEPEAEPFAAANVSAVKILGSSSLLVHAR
jgi:hypothetical protein